MNFSTQSDFATHIRQECITGSAIAPTLFAVAIAIHADLELDGAGDPTTPIHDALNWTYTRFGYQARPSLYGALLQNEDGSTWQVKLSTPVMDREQGHLRKYERAKGSGSTPYLPPIPGDVRELIGDRYGVAVPTDGSFWEWLATQPHLPIIFTEGGKKALALLSQGYVAIALLGVNGGYRVIDSGRKRSESRELIPELTPFVQAERELILAFDQDPKPDTRQRVATAIGRFGELLTAAGSSVSVATWHPDQGKGVDDLIVQSGLSSWQTAYSDRQPLAYWQWQQDYQSRFDLGYPATVPLNQRYLGNLDLPAEAKLIGIKSPRGTGKTEALIDIVRQAHQAGQWVLVLGHRVQLVKQLCDRLGLPYVTEIHDQGILLGYGLCIDSLHSRSQANFNARHWRDGVVILDEAEQVIWHVLNSNTCKPERVEILTQLRTLITNALASEYGRVILSDADLSQAAIRFVQGLGDRDIAPYIIQNDYQFEQPWTIHPHASREALMLQARGDLTDHPNHTALILTSSQKARGKWSSQTLEKQLRRWFPTRRILRIDSQTISDPSHPAYDCINRLNTVLPNYDVVVASPTIETGVSIDLRGHFTNVYALMSGNLPVTSSAQFLARLRDPVPRHIFAEPYGKIGCIGDGSTQARSLIQSQHKLVRQAIARLNEADLAGIDTEFDRAALTAWTTLAARVNAGQIRYRDTLLFSLIAEGHQLAAIAPDPNDNPPNHPGGDEAKAARQAISEELQATRDANRLEIAENEANADPLTASEFAQLEKQRHQTPRDRHRLARYRISQRYCTETPTPELCMKDANGWYPKIRLHYYLTVGRPYLQQRDLQQLTSLIHRGKLWLPDAATTPLTLKIWALHYLGIEALLDPDRAYRGSDSDVQAIAEAAIAHRQDLRQILHITVSPQHRPMQICQQLLRQLGMTLQFDGRDRHPETGKPNAGERWYRLHGIHDGRDLVFSRWVERDAAAAMVDPATEIGSTSPLTDQSLVSRWLHSAGISAVDQGADPATGIRSTAPLPDQPPASASPPVQRAAAAVDVALADARDLLQRARQIGQEAVALLQATFSADMWRALSSAEPLSRR